MTYLVIYQVSDHLEPGQTSECPGREPDPPHSVWPECREWMLSVHTAVLTQQGLGHSCICQVGEPGLHSQPGQGGGTPRRLQGVPGPAGLETQVLDLELGGWLSERLLLPMALPCLGLTQPSPAAY